MALDSDALVPLVDTGLGNSSYLLDLGDGRALAVDPPRDLRALRAAADRRGLTVAHVADTHLHADFLSGAQQLATTDQAQIVASAAGRRAFEHLGLADGHEVDLGGLTLRAVATPGHTDEHLSYLILDGATPQGVFTGGSLIVGAAARTDLLGTDRTVELARAQYDSLKRLTLLPDDTRVWPTHGAGSFCSAAPGGERTSTIGREKAQNTLLAAPDANAFVAQLTATLGSYPRYFDRLAEVNRRGVPLLDGHPGLPRLDVADVRRLLGNGAVVVDVRPVHDVAVGHIPGAIAIPLRAQFVSWLGWVVPPDVPVVVVRDLDQGPDDVLWAALNIGYENLVGELEGGIVSWRAAGEAVATTRLVAPDQVVGSVLDVRQEAEYVRGHLPASTNIELGELSTHTGGVSPDVVMCGHGERAMTGASLLARAGRPDVAVLVGGAEDWAKASGSSLHDGR